MSARCVGGGSSHRGRFVWRRAAGFSAKLDCSVLPTQTSGTAASRQARRDAGAAD